jgi:hypothetical protein
MKKLASPLHTISLHRETALLVLRTDAEMLTVQQVAYHLLHPRFVSSGSDHHCDRVWKTREVSVRAQGSPCGICVEQSGTGQVFLRVIRFFPVSNILPLHHIDSYTICRMDKGPGSVLQKHGLTPLQQQ